MPLRAAVACFLLWLSAPLCAEAQVVRGVVVDQGDRPVAGVVLQLVDSVSAVGTRTLSNERGEFRLSAAHAGTYRLQFSGPGAIFTYEADGHSGSIPLVRQPF